MKRLLAVVATIAAASLLADEVEPPANDNMQNAEVISGESGSVEGTTNGATSEDEKDPVYVKFDAENSVWYKWKAPATGYFRFDTVGSEVRDTVLCVCTSDGKKTLTSNDDIGIGQDEYLSRVLFSAKAGTEYLIGVGAYNGSDCEWYQDEASGEWYMDCGDLPPFVLNWRKSGDTGTLKVTTEPFDDERAGGKATGGGTYKIGKKVTLKATPNKGCVFAGWYLVVSNECQGVQYYSLEGDVDYRNTSFPYVVEDDEGVSIVAQFATAAEDSHLAINVGRTYWEEWVCDDDECETGHTELVERIEKSINVGMWSSGGEFEMAALYFVDSISLPKLTVKGLPTGLKYDSKTGIISGKATKPGVYRVTFSATNATIKKPVTKEIDFIVPNQTCAALPNLNPDTDAYGTIYGGVAFESCRVDCTPEDGWTVKASGLPAGLSFKDGEITGIPTKAGTYTVTFTASKKGEPNQTATITLKIEAAPEWATGTFTGWVDSYSWLDSETSSDSEYGFATITVGANGKTSGKVSLGGTNYTFTAANYSAVDSENDWMWNDETQTDEYVSWVYGCCVSGELKAGKTTIPVSFWIIPIDGPKAPVSESMCVDYVELPNAYAYSYDEDSHVAGDRSLVFRLYRNVWKDKATATAAKNEISKWEGVYTLSMWSDGYLSITVGKDGTVKASGKLGDGTAVSASSPLMYDKDDAEGYFTLFYVAPSTYNGGSFWLPVGFGETRGELCAVISAGLLWNRNPQSTGEYGEEVQRWLEFEGAYYDKNEKLSAYYDQLRFVTEAPFLLFTYKETYIDEVTKKKTTSSYIADAYAKNTLEQVGCTVGVGDKGFVVEKATKPVKDKYGVWSYNGRNDGALTLSFAQATGIFKGSYTFWYDYISAWDETKEKETVAHTSKKASFEGVWVQGSGLSGCFAWEQPASYVDPKTKKEKTYKYKEAYGVSLQVLGE